MRVITYILPMLLLCSCASYYQLNYDFSQNFEQGNIEEAKQVLDKNKKAAEKKARFLYFANQGVVEHMLGNYQQSNEWLEQAYVFGDDYSKNYLQVAGSFFSNPNLITYPGEDHEHLMLLYYKALNYFKLNDFDAALIECRRLNQRLYELGDKYKSENKYREDAFVHTLMGIAYDAKKDYNNAFIAYRNALNIYEGSYKELFNLRTPTQLKEDLIRTAALAGFPDERATYEQQFNMSYTKYSPAGGDLVFFWHNGLIPVKEEWSVNFITKKGEDGTIIFFNEALGLFFSFPYSEEDEEENSITSLSGTRVTFPKYSERKPFFNQGILSLGNKSHRLEKAEDLGAIAVKTLNERMVEELGKGLLRLAIKKSLEKKARDEGDGLGMLVSAINFATEQADTRNWQTLPNAIHYTRVPLKEGTNNLTFTAKGRSTKNANFTYKGKRGTTQFQTYQSLETASRLYR